MEYSCHDALCSLVPSLVFVLNSTSIFGPGSFLCVLVLVLVLNVLTFLVPIFYLTSFFGFLSLLSVLAKAIT